MDINRFKKIISYSYLNRELIEEEVREFYARAKMDDRTELLNLIQIVRPIFQDNGYIIVQMPLKDREIGALCYKGDLIGYTFINTALPKVNVNFALCHEIYHVICQKTEFNQKIELFNEHYYDCEAEFAANLFAGMLLMPEKSFKFMYDKFTAAKDSKQSNLTVLVQLMNYFEAPYMAVLLRCYELKLFESGDVLEELIKIDNTSIRSEFAHLWLDESILNPSMTDDYPKLEYMIKNFGKMYQADGYLSDSTVKKVIQNMQTLYKRIRG